MLGELGLDGGVRPVPGTLALVSALARAGTRTFVVPADNAAEAALVPNVVVHPARALDELRACLKGEQPWPPVPPPLDPFPDEADDDDPLDLAEVRGLAWARRALEAAAAGGHHLLLTGPPGVGKTMLARRLATVLPDLSTDEALEVTRIHSVAGRVTRALVERAAVPLSAPHGIGCRARRRRQRHTPPRRGDDGSSRRSVPRRARRVPAARARRAASTARGARGLDRPAGDLAPLPRRLPPRRVHQPVSVRARAAEVRMWRGRARALPTALVGSAPRPIRPQARGTPTRPRRPARRAVQRRPPARDAAVERQRARLAGTPWRRNAHIPAGALQRFAALDSAARRRVARRVRGPSADRPRCCPDPHGSRRRWPISTTSRRSRPSTSPSHRCSERTCRERGPDVRRRSACARTERDRRSDACLPPRHDAGAAPRAPRPLRRPDRGARARARGTHRARDPARAATSRARGLARPHASVDGPRRSGAHRSSPGPARDARLGRRRPRLPHPRCRARSTCCADGRRCRARGPTRTSGRSGRHARRDAARDRRCTRARCHPGRRGCHGHQRPRHRHRRRGPRRCARCQRLGGRRRRDRSRHRVPAAPRDL